MRFDILTLFPEAFAYLSQSILGKAEQKGIIDINIHDIRGFSQDKHRKVDDKAFGGSPGMVIQIQPIHDCLVSIGVFPKKPNDKTIVVLMQAGGELWDQPTAKSFASNYDRVVLICGHYQGVDGRVAEYLVDAEISVGEYVLTGGEIPAMIVVDSVARLLTGTLGNSGSLENESYSSVIKKSAPVYSLPRAFTLADGREVSVPEVLFSGNHSEIKKWQENTSLKSDSQQ